MRNAPTSVIMRRSRRQVTKSCSRPIFFTPRLWIELREWDETLALVQRHDRKEVRVDDGIAGGAECNGDGDAKSANERQPGRLREDARAELDVERGRRRVSTEEPAEDACETIEGESHDEGECFEPVPTRGGDRAPSGAARKEELLEVAVDFVADVVGKRRAEKRSGEARG